MSFVTLASASKSFHPAWLILITPSLAGERAQAPISVALLQNYLAQQTTEWVHMMLSPFFSRLVAGKMKRKRALKDTDLIESFNIAVELLTSDEGLNALPRSVQALAGLLWTTSRNLGVERAQQIQIVADFFFQRLVYPVLLVPDQYGLVEEGRPLSGLAKQILQGVSKCLSACIYQMDLSPTVYAALQPHMADAWSKISAFCEKLAVDPQKQGWWDHVNFPEEIIVGPSAGDGGLGLWLSLLLEDDSASAECGQEFVQLMEQCRVVGSELERRRAIANVINEEQEFTLRVDGVTFWLRELDYGVMMEGTAMRMANEWLKKVNQLRAVLRIGLNKRTHPSQWNGIISDLIESADWTVFAEFAKILRSNLAIVANSVDESLEQAIKAYKLETSRDPLRDLVALLVHGRSMLSRFGRLPPALDPKETERLDVILTRARESMDQDIASDCSEMVRLHQMQTSIVAGWSNFPSELLEQSGMVRPGRKQVHYGKVSVPNLKTAKYAMLLSDALVLLAVIPATKTEETSSARDREANFGGGNAFQQKMVTAASAEPKKRGKKDNEGDKEKKQVDQLYFRLVKCFHLSECQLRLRPNSNSFVIIDQTAAVTEIAVVPSQKMDWITAWARIEGMEHSRPKSTHSGNNTPPGSDSPRTPGRGRSGGATPRSTESTPRSGTATAQQTPNSGSDSSVAVPSDDEDDVDEMEALMALGMYDTAVIVKTDVVANEADNAFASMVGQIKRRDGKQRVSLTNLFTPPPGLVVKEWQNSIRMMRHVQEPSQPTGGDPLSPRGTVISVETDKESVQRAESEEQQLRAMFANMKATLRFISSEKS